MLSVGDAVTDGLKGAQRPPQGAGLLVKDTVGDKPEDGDGLTEEDALADVLRRHTAA